MDRRRIVAMGGGGFSMEPDNLLLDRFVLSLAASSRPRVCFLGTASGDSERYARNFFRAFSRLDCAPVDLPLFERGVGELDAFVLGQDVIYVGGGSTVNLLAVWRAHGLDAVLCRAWKAGVVLAGLSAGMNCWFEASLTDSFNVARLAPLHDGLGLLPGSSCPHYDGEERRRPTYRRLVAQGELGEGWAADDGAALVFAGTRLHEVVSSRTDAVAYRVSLAADGGVSEEPVTARYLGA
jgi:peptidase E